MRKVMTEECTHKASDCASLLEATAHELPKDSSSSEFPALDEEYFGDSNASSKQAQPEPQPLDDTCYPSFAPLIRACQEYAKFSGCRFSIRAFDGIDCESNTRLPVVNDMRSRDEGPLLSAKLHAVSSVHSFADRLKNGDLELVEDLTRAFDLAIQESARNSMIASCKAAEIFPPSPKPSGVADEDCSWDEVGLASAWVIAQRLYNDEAQRLTDLVDGRNLTLVRAKTASFVVEFAEEIGVGLPQMPPERMDMLEQFQRDIVAWKPGPDQLVAQPPSSNLSELNNFLGRRENRAGAAFLLGATMIALGGAAAAAHIGFAGAQASRTARSRAMRA